MKGIIIAGGTGSRLHPLTITVSKQLLPVYDKPMIFYPLSTLLRSGIREILVITTPRDLKSFERLLGDGSQWNICIRYEVQTHPNGIAEALIIGEEFLEGSPVALILGDNLFTGEVIQPNKFAGEVTGATIYPVKVANAAAYGVVEFDADRTPISIEEKPTKPKSNYAISGLYVFDSNAPAHAKTLKPSARGELEITDVIKIYMNAKNLSVSPLPDSVGWFDMGTHDSLFEASQLVRAIQMRTGSSVGDPALYVDNASKKLEKLNS